MTFEVRRTSRFASRPLACSVYPAVGLLLVAAHVVIAQQPDPDQMQRYFQEGERALAESRYADAEKAYEKLRQLDPGTAELHAKLGVIYFQQGKFTQAIPALRQALKLKPSLPNADVLLAMCLSETGHFAEALPGLEKGFHKSTDPALKRMSGLQLTRAYTGLARDSDAVAVALELKRLYPDDPEILYHTSRLFANYAYLTLRKLAEVAPASVWRRQAAAEAYESQGQFELAAIEYRRVLELDLHRPGIHFRLGRVLLAASQQPDAMKEFAQELDIDPSNANAAYELAELHRKSQQLDQARELFEAALKQDSNFEEAQIGMGKVLLALGKPDLALPHLQKAVALNPQNDVAHYQLSKVYHALGNQAGQQKEIAEYRRLRDQQSHQEILALQEVTKQGMDGEILK